MDFFSILRKIKRRKNVSVPHFCYKIVNLYATQCRFIHMTPHRNVYGMWLRTLINTDSAEMWNLIIYFFLFSFFIHSKWQFLLKLDAKILIISLFFAASEVLISKKKNLVIKNATFVIWAGHVSHSSNFGR